MKKAMQWLDQQGLAYQFHDYKTKGVDAQQVQRWLQHAPSNVVVNTKGTTWKKLSPEDQALLQHPDQLIPLLCQHTSALKRPIVEADNTLLIGFDENKWKQVLAQ